MDKPLENPLVSAIVSVFDTYILALVDKRVAEIMQAQATMHLMDDKLSKKIDQLVIARIEEAIDEHEARQDHPSEDAITQEINHAINEFDIDDKVRDAVRHLTFSVEVDY